MCKFKNWCAQRSRGVTNEASARGVQDTSLSKGSNCVPIIVYLVSPLQWVVQQLCVCSLEGERGALQMELLLLGRTRIQDTSLSKGRSQGDIVRAYHWHWLDTDICFGVRSIDHLDAQKWLMEIIFKKLFFQCRVLRYGPFDTLNTKVLKKIICGGLFRTPPQYTTVRRNVL